MGKHQHKGREYPRVSTREQAQNELLDDYEAWGSRLRKRFHANDILLDAMAAVLEEQIDAYARLDALAEQRRVDLQGLRGQE